MSSSTSPVTTGLRPPNCKYDGPSTPKGARTSAAPTLGHVSTVVADVDTLGDAADAIGELLRSLLGEALVPA
jgi:hypothetical protein